MKNVCACILSFLTTAIITNLVSNFHATDDNRTPSCNTKQPTQKFTRRVVTPFIVDKSAIFGLYIHTFLHPLWPDRNCHATRQTVWRIWKKSEITSPSMDHYLRLLRTVLPIKLLPLCPDGNESMRNDPKMDPVGVGRAAEPAHTLGTQCHHIVLKTNIKQRHAWPELPSACVGRKNDGAFNGFRTKIGCALAWS